MRARARARRLRLPSRTFRGIFVIQIQGVFEQTRFLSVTDVALVIGDNTTLSEHCSFDLLKFIYIYMYIYIKHMIII